MISFLSKKIMLNITFEAKLQQKQTIVYQLEAYLYLNVKFALQTTLVTSIIICIRVMF